MKKMKIWKKAAAIALTAAMCVSCLAACGKDGGEEQKGQKNDGGNDSKEKLTVWVEKVFSEDANNRMAEALEKYSQDTGIEVDVEFINGFRDQVKRGRGSRYDARHQHRRRAEGHELLSEQSIPGRKRLGK